MSSDQLIISRLLCELKGVEKIALGPGLPEKLIPYLDPGQSWIRLKEPTLESENVHVALVEAVEVSETGQLAISSDVSAATVKADTWIAAGALRSPEGSLQLVRSCTLPSHVDGRVDLIVTELGVIRVSGIGFELVEISPGVGSDDIRMQVRASLHVADDLKRMQLCA